MVPSADDFQIFAKPVGGDCNLACGHCYYLRFAERGRGATPRAMDDGLLELYISQHIAASAGQTIRFSWHGGEPALAGIAFYRRALALQERHRPAGRVIRNALVSNGTLLDDSWCDFLAEAGFAVGLSLDGPPAMHDRLRRGPAGEPTGGRAMLAYERLRRRGVACDLLCVVGGHNAAAPGELFRFFSSIDAPYLSFLPLVERRPGRPSGLSRRSVNAEAWGEFLCAYFDDWRREGAGRMRVQLVEESVRAALGREHALCVLRPTCGVPVIERDGDVYPCDHYVDPGHRLGNIRETPLAGLLAGDLRRAFGEAKRATLPAVCRSCEVLDLCHGGCQKDRFVKTAAGEPGLNALCSGYRRFFLHLLPFLAEVASLRGTSGADPEDG